MIDGKNCTTDLQTVLGIVAVLEIVVYFALLLARLMRYPDIILVVCIEAH
jgi:hypothetical protein